MDRLHGKRVVEPQLDTSQQVHCVGMVSTRQPLLPPSHSTQKPKFTLLQCPEIIQTDLLREVVMLF